MRAAIVEAIQWIPAREHEQLSCCLDIEMMMKWWWEFPRFNGNGSWVDRRNILVVMGGLLHFLVCSPSFSYCVCSILSTPPLLVHFLLAAFSCGLLIYLGLVRTLGYL